MLRSSVCPPSAFRQSLLIDQSLFPRETPLSEDFKRHEESGTRPAATLGFTTAKRGTDQKVLRRLLTVEPSVLPLSRVCSIKAKVNTHAPPVSLSLARELTDSRSERHMTISDAEQSIRMALGSSRLYRQHVKAEGACPSDARRIPARGV